MFKNIAFAGATYYKVVIKNAKRISVFGLALFFAATGLFGLISPSKVSAAANTYYVSTTGDDLNPGTEAAPWKTVTKGVKSVMPGDTLYVRGGTYAERIQNPIIQPGTATAGITVMAYPNERPVISGLLWLKGASYWTLDGINVTWGATNTAGEHMTKMTDGTGWRITNAEIWGAHSYAGLLVAGAPSNWLIDHSVFHDTYASNSTNQDHLIYVNTDATNGSGTIERNIFYNSANGRGLKVGPPNSTANPIGAVTVRYNTFYNNTGPSNIQLSYGASFNKVYRNIFQKTGAGKTNVTDYNINGTGNQVFKNVGWESTAVADPTLADPTNLMIDPQFVNVAGNDFTPTNPIAAEYGRYAAPHDDDVAPTDTTAPTVPTGLSTLQIMSSSVVLNWTASSDDTAVTSYDVYRDAVKVGSSSATSFTDSGLVPTTVYSYTIIALDGAGNASLASDPLVVTTADPVPLPASPVDLAVAQVSESSVGLTWAPGLDGAAAASFDIYRGTTKVGSSATPDFTDSGLSAATTYSYTVVALDSFGNASPASAPILATTTDTTAPTAPTGLSAGQVTGTSAAINWAASTDNVSVAHYDVYRDTIKIGSTQTTSYSDTGLASTTSYSYTVVAVDAAGNVSPVSSPVSVTTLDTTAPTTPTSVIATQVTGTSVTLSWAASTDNVGVTSYSIYRGSTKVGSTTSTTFTNTGLSQLTSYSYTIVALDATGNASASSSPLLVKTLDATKPSTPSSLKVTATANTTVSLSWKASTDNVKVVGYYIYRNGSSTPVALVTGTTYTDSGLARRTSYTYTVKAVDAAGNLSSASSSVKGTTK